MTLIAAPFAIAAILTAAVVWLHDYICLSEPASDAEQNESGSDVSGEWGGSVHIGGYN